MTRQFITILLSKRLKLIDKKKKKKKSFQNFFFQPLSFAYLVRHHYNEFDVMFGINVARCLHFLHF